MRTVTLLEFRKNAGEILDAVESGGEVVLTRRGKPSVRLTSAIMVANGSLPPDDPIFHIDRFVVESRKETPLDPREIDRLVCEL